MNKREMKETIYILKFTYPYFTTFELFKDTRDTHYVQYKKKWDELYTVKHWSINELVGKYEDWDDMLLVELTSVDITF